MPLDAAVEIVCQPAPGLAAGRANEDACLFHHGGDWLALAAIDGATVRVQTQALTPLLVEYGPGVSAAAYAAYLTRDTATAHICDPPAEMLLSANAALNAVLTGVYGALTPEAVFAAEPGLAAYAHDPRFFRLVLPVCVATAVRLDLAAQRLEYAHAGDTALLLFMADGHVRAVTGGAGDVVPPDYASWSSDKRARYTVESGIRHNYVDDDGQPDSQQGVAVINGLPQLAHYLHAGEQSLAGVDAVLVCTDGLLWPNPPNEDAAGQQARLAHMRALIESEGLAGYLERLRAEERADRDRVRYPRFKSHDDATGLYVRLSAR